MGTDKRERKRMARAEREQALRRRRNARIAAITVVIALVLALALFASGGEDGERPATKPTPSEEDIAACDADPPEAPEPQQYDAPPPMTLEEKTDYAAIIRTSCGEIEMDLLEEKAPETVSNFVFLANEGFYDGLTWHRIERNFVIQGGDPEGTGGGGPGYTIPDEFPQEAKEYVYGIVGMANSGQPNSGGSQFFIIVHEPKGKPAGLQPLYTIFGQVARSSHGTLDEISALEVQGGNDPATAARPVVPVYIESVEIIER